MGKSDGNRPLGEHRRMWEDNIKMDLKGMGGRARPMAGSCGCGNEPLGSIKRTEYLDYLHTCYLPRKHCSMELVCLSVKNDMGKKTSASLPIMKSMTINSITVSFGRCKRKLYMAYLKVLSQLLSGTLRKTTINHNSDDI